MARLLDRYIVREIVPPFLIGLLLITFVLLMDQVLLLADLFIDKGVPLPVALRVLGLLIPSILVFALPMAVLMGVLGGLARLSADSEIVALRTLGIGPRGLARPLAFSGLCAFVLTLPLALYVAPRANNAWVREMANSVLARIRLDVEPLEFNASLPDLVFMVREVGRDKVWHDVFAYLSKDPMRPRVVMARTGTVRLFPERRRAILDLADGVVYEGSFAAPGDDTRTTFARLEEEIDVEELFASVSSNKRVREKDIGELVRDLRTLEADPAARTRAREIRAHRIEIHKKLALPAAGLVFALLGLPLGLMTGRAGRTGGFSLALVVILLYYALLTVGEKAAMDGRISALLGMWGPDAFFMVAGVLLLTKSAGSLTFLRHMTARRPLPRPEPISPGATSGPDSPPAACPRQRPSARALRASIRFPSLLDRYILRKFLALLGFILAALAAAVLLLTFFENLNEILQHGKPVGLLAAYVLFKLPEYLSFLLPAAVLASALLALGLLARTNEATALKACGISAYRIVLPILVMAAAAGAFAFLVQERVVPASSARSEAAWNTLHDLPPRASNFLNRHWVLGGGGRRIYHFDFFEPGTETLGRLSVFEIDPARWALTRRTFAPAASIDGAALVYRDGWSREFDAAPGRPAFVRSAAGRLDAGTDRDLFEAPRKEPLEMTFGDLKRYAAEVRAMGLPAVKLRAALAQKIALPFASLVMALLAVPFGFRMGRKGTLVGIGLSVVLAMAFWGTFAVLRSLGGAGVLPPALGAWGAGILFGLGGLWGLLRIRT